MEEAIDTRGAGLPVVSVLVLAYNQAAFLRQTLDGILAQRLDVPFEVLVGDDCSTDDSRELLTEYADRYPSRIRLFVHARNLGMHANHAFLLDRARGPYIAYCEGDDYWTVPDKLQRQLDCFKADPELGLVHSNYLNLIHLAGRWRTRVAFRSRRQLSMRDGHLYPVMLQSNRIQTCTVMCRTELLREYRKTGPGVDSYLVGDWPQTLWLTHQARVAFLPEPMAAYRRTAGSATNSGANQRVQFGLDALRMVGDFCDYFSDPVSVRNAALSAQHSALMNLAFMARDEERFKLSRDWLAEQAPAMLRSVKAIAMQRVVQMPRLHRLWLLAVPIIESIKHRFEFRQPGGVD